MTALLNVAALTHRGRLCGTFCGALQDTDTISSFAESTIVTIVVGPEEVEFKAHKDVLEPKAAYFEECFNADWEEGRTNTVVWKSEGKTPRAVAVLMDWIYDRETNRAVKCKDYVSCYKLAHSRALHACFNCILDRWRSHCYTEWHHPAARYAVYARSIGLGGTPLYKWMIDAIAQALVNNTGTVDYANGIEQEENEIRQILLVKDEGVLHDVILGILRYQLKPDDDPCAKEGCFYHDHSDGSKCESEEDA